jgi:ATP-binding protein involved in chromosome partitioning
MNTELKAALSSVIHPGLGQDLISLGMVTQATLEGKTANIAVQLMTAGSPLRAPLTEAIEAAVEARVPGTKVYIAWTSDAKPSRFGGGLSAKNYPSLDRVQHIILVASGKGGVGKSTVAANLACALMRGGARVGIMDADIYGPSVPTMFDLHKDVFSKDGKTIEPHVQYGLKMMSMGFFVAPDKAMIWRGPMLMSAINQFLGDVSWGELDYLILDLPPGTGDVQLTLAQSLTVTGAVVVSTPQEVALADVVRAQAMFESVKIPVLGLVENMSYFLCDGCDKKHFIFDEGGGSRMAAKYGLDVLAELPLDPALRASGDQGMPLTEEAPESPAAQRFIELGRAVAGKVAALQAAGPPVVEEEASSQTKAGRRSLPVVN